MRNEPLKDHQQIRDIVILAFSTEHVPIKEGGQEKPANDLEKLTTTNESTGS